MDKKTLRELMSELFPAGITSFKQMIEDSELSAPARLYFLSTYYLLDKKTKVTMREKVASKIKKKVRVWIKRRKITIKYLKDIYGKQGLYRK